MTKQLDHEEAIKQALENGRVCPYCDTEMDTTSEHERDSSNDRTYCPKCKWSFSMMEEWAVDSQKYAV